MSQSTDSSIPHWGFPPKPWGILLNLVAVALLAGSASSILPSARANDLSPTITSLRTEKTNLFLTVKVPKGLRRLTLEARTQLAGQSTWDARELQWPDGEAGEFSFTIPMDRTYEIFQIKGTDTQAMPLPAKFYKGKRTFSPVTLPGQASQNQNPSLGGALEGTPAPQLDSKADSGTRSVVESDIWQIHGKRVYFFNQYRGLQVIDIADPDAPVLKGTLELPSVGEQMYVLPEHLGESGKVYVALLAHDPCAWDKSEVVIVEVTENGQPSEVARQKVAGQIRESRLVGDVLYTVSADWGERTEFNMDPKTGNTVKSTYWANLTTLQSFNLSTPITPIAKSSNEVDASLSAIYATDQFLVLATQGYRSALTYEKGEVPWVVYGNYYAVLFDISDPAGAISQAGSVKTAGLVDNKFKINIRGDTLSIVSQSNGQWVPEFLYDKNGVPIGSSGRWSNDRGAWLETFSLATAGKPEKTGELFLIKDESVYGTRFDGDRVYVVTFKRVDPLWIINLSDPKKPRIEGELEIPGFSTYLEPLGDRLVTMGQESGGVAVSLFDVADPKKTKLLSRVKLGEWSWSEANNDEKAFKVFADDGLILVPWSGQVKNPSSTTSGSSSFFRGIQLIDLSHDSLKTRGVIDHKLQARRAALHENRVISVSGTELLSANISDRNNPVIKASLELAYSVDQLLISGNFLLKFSGSDAWTGQSARIRVSSTTDPDVSLSEYVLDDAPVVGSALKGDTLFLLQKFPDTYSQKDVVSTNEVVEKTDDGGGLRTNWVVVTNSVFMRIQGGGLLSTIDAKALPTIRAQSVVKFEFGENYWGGRLTAHWPSAGNLVWAEQAGYSGYLIDAARSEDFISTAAIGRPGFWWGWWGGNNMQRLYSFDVQDSMASKFLNVIVLDGTNEPKPAVNPDDVKAKDGEAANVWRSFQGVFAGSGKIFVGHQFTKSFSGVGADEVDEKGLHQWHWNQEPRTEYSYFLDVVDLTHPTAPIVKTAVAIPGQLEAVALEGALLMTSRTLWDSKDPNDGSRLDLLAFDGDAVSSVDKLPLGNVWPQPYKLLADGSLLFGRSKENSTDQSLELWQLGGDAKLHITSSVTLKNSSVYGFHLFGDLIVGEGNTSLVFLGSKEPRGLEVIDSFARPCNLYLNWDALDANRNSGLWAPSGYSQIWHVSLRPVPGE